MKRFVWMVFLLAGFAALAALVWKRTHDGDAGKSGARGGMPVAVETATVRSGSAPVGFAAVGQVQSPHSVAIRPQVTGILTEVFFEEGANVAAGARLAQIDPAPYRAAAAQARAALDRDRSVAHSAQARLNRLLPLAARDYATPQELEQARGEVDEALAVVRADEAALAAAQVDLARTLIASPIAGRTGSLGVKPGNVVGPSDATPLLTINQMQPVEIVFSVPQSRLSAIREALNKAGVSVRIFSEDGARTLDEGRLRFIDNAVDSVTGTVRLKAEADNAGETLWPGTFVALDVTLSVQADALLVPETAVQAGADGPFVYLVDPARKAVVRRVAVDRQAGTELVISRGLAAGDVVVSKAPRSLTPGMTLSLPGDAKGQAPVVGHQTR